MLTSLLLLIDTPEERNRFEQLYHEYERLMFYVAKKRLGDDHLAEDAVNEAFIRIFKNFDKIEEIVCPRTKKYVVVIVRNVCADIYARRHKDNEFSAGDDLEYLAETSDSNIASTQDAFFQKYDLGVLGAALKELPEIYQTTLYLYIVEERNWAEIADIMDCNIETVKKRIYRARRDLRAILEVHDGK